MDGHISCTVPIPHHFCTTQEDLTSGMNYNRPGLPRELQLRARTKNPTGGKGCSSYPWCCQPDLASRTKSCLASPLCHPTGTASHGIFQHLPGLFPLLMKAPVCSWLLCLLLCACLPWERRFQCLAGWAGSLAATDIQQHQNNQHFLSNSTYAIIY